MTGTIDWKKEMKNLLLKPLRTVFLAFGMATTAFIAVSPLQPAMAQARALPDFTDLVDLVGPSVVNIRTMEKVNLRTAQGGQMDEDMLEFFKRFGRVEAKEKIFLGENTTTILYKKK